jgi:hypothetical protein
MLCSKSAPKELLFDFESPCSTPPEDRAAEQNNFLVAIAHNPLKCPDSDERNKIKPRKTKENKALFAWFGLDLLGEAARRSRNVGGCALRLN